MTVVLVVFAVWLVSCVPLGWWACRRDHGPRSRRVSSKEKFR
ncbi:predicted protein [Streptomyces sp. SPB78]|uniref:Uncharacterized protein n=1 Tax=Streptomyces phage SF3 TaxID=1690818 RepID=A0A0M3UKC8_9CAUD|nr:hypothetical protein [Streptomyces sp. SPB78]YP_009213191.1 hypothetical protein AVV12_gp64 [Streptomyces phage SF3]ALF00195.1 hypothetical protein SF3_640 [Streptomyces phage SF3]EFL00603.1 predicted protein [Streptomyces sp. SPB78]